MLKSVVLSILSLTLASSMALASEEFIETTSVQVCTIPLPVTDIPAVNRAFMGTKHIYIRMGEKTYGTPYNKKKSYFGGDAYLYTNDLFWSKLPDGEKCYSVKRRSEDSDEAFAKRTKCIADKLARPDSNNGLKKDWYGVFDYHFLKNNCGSMAKYLISCAEGKAEFNFNFKVGDEVDDSTPGKIVTMSSDEEYEEPSTYGDICLKASTECEYEELD